MGSADISAILKSRRGTAIPWKIEIKLGHDRQSEARKKYQEQVEAGGGIYSIIRSFIDFMEIYNSLLNDSKKTLLVGQRIINNEFTDLC